MSRPPYREQIATRAREAFAAHRLAPEGEGRWVCRPAGKTSHWFRVLCCPHLCVREDYALEYGSGTLEMHADRLDGKRAVVIDDLLATGGTAACAARLCRRLGAVVVGFAFVIELSALGGRAALGDAPVDSLLTY